jgi:hypothetical protein
VRTVSILDSVSYARADAIAELSSHLGWTAYANKHGESVFTSIYQNVYLPLRFGIDKRRAHFSSEVIAGAITRAEAIDALARPPLEVDAAVLEAEFVCEKLGVTVEEFLSWLDEPIRQHLDLPSDHRRAQQVKTVRDRLIRRGRSS